MCAFWLKSARSLLALYSPSMAPFAVMTSTTGAEAVAATRPLEVRRVRASSAWNTPSMPAFEVPTVPWTAWMD